MHPMTSREIRVPDIGDFKNVLIIEVHVKPGSSVKPEDPLITLESDKASLEVPSPLAGSIVETCRYAALITMVWCSDFSD